ncbi:MAG: hypothetical protein ACM3UU_11725 [Ignavibacteriales bacterium]
MDRTMKSNLFVLVGVIIFCFLGLGSSDSSSTSDYSNNSYDTSSSSSSSDSSDSSSSSNSSSSWLSYAPDGTSWNTLTQSEKENLVKEYLTNLKNNGYQINRSISWFVSNLDAFYDDNTGSTNSTKVPEAISMIGIMDNAISK